jgi:hypothetical protein
MKYFIHALLFLTLSFTASASETMTRDDVTMPSSINIDGTNLVLNGLGTRKATFLKIKVYVGGLYLAEKNSAPEAFLNDGKTKRLVMNFVRNVGKDDLNKAWKEGFDAAIKDQAPVKAGLETLLGVMEDVKKGDQIVFTFFADKAEVSVKGKPVTVIEGKEFSSGLLSIWFINARDTDLRDGLLGK